MEWGGGVREGQEEGIHEYLWLIHIVVRQKPPRRKAIILQLKINLKKKPTVLHLFTPTDSSKKSQSKRN